MSSYFNAANVYEASAGSCWYTRLQSINATPHAPQWPAWVPLAKRWVWRKQCKPCSQSALVQVIFMGLSVFWIPCATATRLNPPRQTMLAVTEYGQHY